MVAFTSLAVISLGFLAAQITAISPADAIASLGRRQPGISPSDLPAACQSGCTTILTTITSCNSNITSGLACICTSANVASLQSCVNCIVSSSSLSAAEAEEGSSLIKSFNAECVGKGIASLTVSSASASATGSTTGSAAGAAGTSSPLKVKGAAGANAGLGMVGLAGLAAVGFAATWL